MALFTITHGPQRLGRYSAEGKLLLHKMAEPRVVEKTRDGKSPKPDFPIPLGNPAHGARFPLSHNLGDG
jgi:hypothetical protein